MQINTVDPSEELLGNHALNERSSYNITLLIYTVGTNSLARVKYDPVRRRDHMLTYRPSTVPSSCPKSISAFPRPLNASTKKGSIRRASLYDETDSCKRFNLLA